MLLVLLACSTPETPAPGEAPAAKASTIRVDGSSTVFPITEAVAEEYRKAGNKEQVTVGISGTGGGFKKFCANETDISDASRPIKPSEVELCAKNGVEYIELPIAYDGIAVVVNPQNDWAASITTEELKKMWEPEAQGTVKKWSDVRPGWPDAPLSLYGAGVDSGTYDYFTEAINHKEHSSRGDFTSSEDDNVLVQGISGDKNAIGFFGIAYYEENTDKLKIVGVDDGKAENGAGPIAASRDAVRDATYQPLSRPLFLYVRKAALDRPEIAAFLDYYVDNAAKLAEEVGYIALPPEAYPRMKARLAARQTGSVFGGKGSQVGATLDTLLADPGAPPPAEPVAADAAPPAEGAAPPAEGAAPAAGH